MNSKIAVAVAAAGMVLAGVAAPANAALAVPSVSVAPAHKKPCFKIKKKKRNKRAACRSHNAAHRKARKAARKPAESRYFANCDAARAAGAAPVRRGEPGYGSHLDRDGDGVGCE